MTKNYPGTYEARIREETFLLMPEKAMLWKEQNILILADLHLGKITHFRKAGIAIPHAAKSATLDNLEDLLLRYSPEKVLLLGDLFHSDYNMSWVAFNDLLERYSDIAFILVQGNHDILSHKLYDNSAMEVIKGHLESGPFLFTHEPNDLLVEGKYNLCGHIHPAVRMKGKAMQSMRLSCFYFGDNTGILPAFGAFTGSATIQPLKGEKVYVIAGEKVIEV